MTHLVSQPATFGQENRHAVAERLATAIRGTTQGLLVLLALLLVARRMSGVFVEPLPGGWFVALIVALASVWWALRWPQLERQRNATSAAQLGVGTMALLLSALAVTLSGTPLSATLLGWFLLLASEGLLWAIGLGAVQLPNRADRSAHRQNVTPPPSGVQHSPDRASVQANATEIADRDLADDLEVDEENFDDERVPHNLIQNIVRSRLDSGGETIEAVVRSAFPPGDLLAVVHVPFCPPLSRPPEVEVDLIDGPDIEPRVTLAEPFGVRVELRRSGDTLEEPVESVIRIFAHMGEQL